MEACNKSQPTVLETESFWRKIWPKPSTLQVCYLLCMAQVGQYSKAVKSHEVSFLRFYTFCIEQNILPVLRRMQDNCLEDDSHMQTPFCPTWRRTDSMLDVQKAAAGNSLLVCAFLLGLGALNAFSTDCDRILGSRSDKSNYFYADGLGSGLDRPQCSRSVHVCANSSCSHS